MTHFETVVLHLLCKILMRLLQAPGARGTLQDAQYIEKTLASIEESKK